MKGIILYEGKYGATRDYAEWMGKELRLPVLRSGELGDGNLSVLDFIVIGSSVYTGKLQAGNWLKRNCASLRKLKIFLFIVCGTPATEKEKLARIVADNVPAEIRNLCEIYFLRGRMRRKDLSVKDRLLLRAGSLLAKNPAARKSMLEDFDYVRKENIVPLVLGVQQFLVRKNGSTSSSVFAEN